MTIPATPLLLFSLLSFTVFGGGGSELDRLLALEAAPFGVVFEIVDGDDDALNWAIPEVKRQIERLRGRFPEIHLAVVTHGKEQFALTTDNRVQYETLHGKVESLVKEEVSVHVCGTHASWYDKTEEDFPAYVDVSPAGPAQINDYRALGYQVIHITEP